MNRQHNGQTKSDKRTNNDLQNSTQRTKDRATWTPLNYVGWTQVYLKGKQFQVHVWHPSCYSCYKTGQKHRISKKRALAFAPVRKRMNWLRFVDHSFTTKTDLHPDHNCNRSLFAEAAILYTPFYDAIYCICKIYRLSAKVSRIFY